MPDYVAYLTASSIAAIVGAVVAATLLAARRDGGAAWRNVAYVVSIAAGLAGGYWMMSLNLAWPPENALDRLLTVVLPMALVMEGIAGIPALSKWLVGVLRLMLAMLTPRILLHDSVYLSGTGEWTSTRAWTIMLFCSVVLMAVWMMLLQFSGRRRNGEVSASIGMALLVAGPVIMMAGYIKGGAAAFPLVAALAGVAITGWVMTGKSERTVDLQSASIIGVGVIYLFGLLFVGRFFGRISTTTASTLFCAPLLCWSAGLPWLRTLKAWKAAAFCLMLVAIPLVIVLLAAWQAFERDMSPLL